MTGLLWFGGFAALLRIVVVGTLSYLSLLLILHVTGQRALGRMKTFDVIVAVAIGSTLGRLMTAQEVQFDEAVVAFVVLIGLHYLLSKLDFWFPQRTSLLGTPPVLLYRHGKLQCEDLTRFRMRETDLLAAIRKRGLRSWKEVEAIVLESDGSISVLARDPDSDYSALADLT